LNSQTTPDFWRAYQSLPADAREMAREAYRLFRDNPNHPGLHFKRIGLREPMYSVRIGLRYRAVGLLDGETIFWWWIGSHAAYDKLRF
jgi:hypothetical protein